MQKKMITKYLKTFSCLSRCTFKNLTTQLKVKTLKARSEVPAAMQSIFSGKM